MRETIGHVEDFLVDDQSWSIRYTIVDTTNWWAGKNLVREHIRTSPEYDPARPIERAYEARLYGHYARPHYWDEPHDKGV